MKKPKILERIFPSSPSERLPAPVILPQIKRKIFGIKVGALIRVTPGKRHAYFESNVGPIRKQI